VQPDQTRGDDPGPSDGGSKEKKRLRPDPPSGRVGSHQTNGFVSSRPSIESSSRPHKPSSTSPSGITPTGAARATPSRLAQPPLGELVGSPAPAAGGRRAGALAGSRPFHEPH